MIKPNPTAMNYPAGATRVTVTLDLPPPRLVVEVVSPQQAERDYRFKGSEYVARGILECWVVDPIDQRVTIFKWVSGFYEPLEFRGKDRLISPTLRLMKFFVAINLGVSCCGPLAVPETEIALDSSLPLSRKIPLQVPHSKRV